VFLIDSASLILTLGIKPDRLNLHIKQRSPLTTQNPIAFSLKSNSDHPSSPTNPIAHSITMTTAKLGIAVFK
jgi:hypothetical protein